MSTPMTPYQIVAQFQKWHVKYREHAGWRDHHRNPGHGSWGPVNGLLLHHTGDDAPDSADEDLLWRGRSDLAGPLCTWGMTDDGVAVLIGGGRANHAGLGAQNVFDALVAESYKDYPPRPGRDSVDGNTHLYGQETMYSGGHPMTDAAYQNTLLAFAAVCDFHNWSARSAIGHKEWTSRKPDPGHLDMAEFRKDLQATLDAGPGGQKEPTKKPAKPAPKPKHIVTPNITAAIKANLAYQAVLKKITDSQGKALATAALEHLGAELKDLREQERK